MEDAQIVEQFLARSEAAVEALEAKYGKLCHQIASNILPSREDAEECVNDAWMSVWNSIPPNRPQSLAAYTVRIVRNLAIDRLRRNTTQKRSCFEVAYDEIAETLAAEDSVDQRMETRLLVQSVEGFLDTLRQEDRVLFLRRYWFSDSYAEIASQLGISEKNVSVKLTRVRKQLKKYLSNRGL